MRTPFRKSLPVKTVLVATAILFFLFSCFALFEYVQSKKDILSLMQEEGYILLDALRTSGERSILSYGELERRIRLDLLSDAALIDALDRTQRLTPGTLVRFAELLNLKRVLILGASGRIELDSNRSAESEKAARFAAPLFSGRKDTAVVGFLEGNSPDERAYAAAVRRKKGGVVVAAAEAGGLLELRREVGPGRLVREIGSRPGVAYAVLQDSMGVLMASRGVSEMNPIAEDPFLRRIAFGGTRGSRMFEFDGRKVFEIAGSFVMEDNGPGVFRIGLALDVYRHTVRNALLRLVFIALIFVFAGVIGLGLFLAGQNVRLISESFRRFETHTGEILQNLEDAVAAVDARGTVTVFNRAAQRLFRIDPAGMVGKPVPGEDIPCFSILRESLRSGQPVVHPQLECPVEGEKRVLFIRTSVVAGAEGNVDAVILVATDLTAQIRLETELRQQEKLKAMGVLASGVAHEIRNPLNAVGMIAQRFLKEFTPSRDEAEYRDLAQAVIREVQRTNGIIQRFLQYASPPPLVLNETEIGRLLAETGSVFESSARARGLTFAVFRGNPFRLRLDANGMKQALLNLLANALDATSEGGRIELRGRLNGNEYWIEVSDTGRGIADSDRSRIFDLYYTTRPEGTGMGLPIVQQIVQGHGGKIDVESEAGHGSTFRIRLPAEGIA